MILVSIDCKNGVFKKYVCIDGGRDLIDTIRIDPDDWKRVLNKEDFFTEEMVETYRAS